MERSEQIRFDKLYQKHLTTLNSRVKENQPLSSTADPYGDWQHSLTVALTGSALRI